MNADAPPIEVPFLDSPDKEINEVGARGIGETSPTLPRSSQTPSTSQPAFACGNCP